MKKQKNHSKIYKIDGVGVNLERFSPASSRETKNQLRQEYGFSPDDFIVIYTAEFIPRKNHQLLFDILPDLKEKIPELKVILCGKGELLEQYKKISAKKDFNYIVFTGYTKDVNVYCRIADVCVSTSLQEGQGLNLVEGMASGLPLVASCIRGHKDVIEDCVNGFLFSLDDVVGFEKAILILYKNPELRGEMGKRNVERAKKFSVEKSVVAMDVIYHTVM